VQVPRNGEATRRLGILQWDRQIVLPGKKNTMNIKMEASETSILKLLQGRVDEDNKKAAESISMLQSYGALLSKKYELSLTGQYSLSQDFTTIIQAPVPQKSEVPAEVPAVEEPAPKRRKRKQVDLEVPVV